MTRRLILWLTAATILLWMCAAVLGAVVMREEFDEVFDSALSETAQRLLPLVVDDIFRREGPTGPIRLPHSPGTQAEEYLTFQVRDATGAVLLHSHDAPAAPFDAPLSPGYHDTPSHRVFTATAVSGSIVLQVADPVAHRFEAMREGLTALLMPVLALIPLSVGAVWLVVSRALKPVGSLSAEIGGRSGANLEPLNLGSLPPELTTIAASVDGLLDRLRKTIEAERSFTANSAHELRTPLAGALAQTQRLIEETKQGPVRDRAVQIERALRSLSRLTEKLLQLARAEAGIGKSTHMVALEPIASMVGEELSRTVGEHRPILVEVAAPLNAAVDVDAFAIVLRNLIENALIHGSIVEPVTVHVSLDRIDVVNAGSTVSPHILERLTQPFERGVAKAQGTGLGLTIANALAQQMGAHLQLTSPAPGRADGLQASLIFRPTEDRSLVAPTRANG